MSAGDSEWMRFTDIMQFEDYFRQKLADVLKEIKKSYKIGGSEIDDVISDWVINKRKADIVVLVDGQPFLIIECKRSLSYGPWDDYPIGQAYTYALLAKKNGFNVEFIATANQYSMTFFKVPDDLENYANWNAIKKGDYANAFKKDLFIKAKYGDLCVTTIDYLLIPRKEQLFDILNKLASERKKIKTLETLNLRTVRKLKGFVEFVSYHCRGIIKHKLTTDRELKKEFERLRKERGVSLTYDQVSKEFAYTLMNRILFYKVLERNWKDLDKLEPLYGKKINGISVNNGINYYLALKHYFRKAVEVTGDFEPVFILDFHDKLILPDYLVILKAIDSLIVELDRIEIEKFGDVIGRVYEEILPPEERHQLGQFYTPHGVAELITKWCIRSSSDLVLDPGTGSGTFLIEAYKRLYKEKTGKDLEGMAEKEIHEDIIKQLYAIDIDEFACHLTAMNLSMKSIINPSSELYIIPSDFFVREPKQEVLLPYEVKTVKERSEKRKIILPEFDCVIGNPPYTAWDEIPDDTKDKIIKKLGKLAEKYSLSPKGGVRQRQNPHIYVYWIMHATKFLKPNGRLGMIISNLWLQTDYGIKFGNFLLDNFKIKAVIDIPLRLFTALITTTIILLEKCDDESQRNENEVVFIRIPTNVEDIKADELLDAINNKKSDKFYVNCIKQSEISRDRKWIRYFFKYGVVSERSDKICKLSDLYEISRGNTTWFILTGAGTGADPFFYLRPSKVEKYNIPEDFLYPAITNVRYAKWFTFSDRDWISLKSKDKECLMFICHTDKLPRSVLKYIKDYGEKDCKVKVGKTEKICSETTACRDRAKRRDFHGWYDLGKVKPAQIIGVYEGWHRCRFILINWSFDKPLAVFHRMLCLYPKHELNELQIKALLSYLNSSFSQFYIETEGRKSGGGVIALETSQAERMPVLDPRKLSDEEVKVLASLFDKLESKAREIGGATTKEQIEQLKPIINEIDRVIGYILGLSDFEIYEIQNTVDKLIERRIAGVRDVKRSAIRGEEEIPELENHENKPSNNQATLSDFFGGDLV